MNTQLFYEAVENYKKEVLGISTTLDNQAMYAFGDDTPEDEMFILQDDTISNTEESSLAEIKSNFNFVKFPNAINYSLGSIKYNNEINKADIANIRDKTNLTPVLEEYVKFNNELLEPELRKSGVFTNVFEYIRFVEDFNYRYLLQGEELDYGTVLSDFILTTFGVLATQEVYANLVNDDLDLVKALAFPFRLVNLEDYEVIKKYYKEPWFNKHLIHRICIKSDVTELICKCMEYNVNWNDLLEFIPINATEPNAFKHALELALRGFKDFTAYKTAVLEHKSDEFMSSLEKMSQDKIPSVTCSSIGETNYTTNTQEKIKNTFVQINENHAQTLEESDLLNDIDLLEEDDLLGDIDLLEDIDVLKDLETLQNNPTNESSRSEMQNHDNTIKYKNHPGYKWIIKLLETMSEHDIDELLSHQYAAIELVLLADHGARIEFDNELNDYYRFLNQVAYSLNISELMTQTPQQVCYDLLTKNAPFDTNYDSITKEYPDFVKALVLAYLKGYISYKDFMCYWYMLTVNADLYHELNGSVKSFDKFLITKLLPEWGDKATPTINNVVVGYRPTQDIDYELITTMSKYDAVKNYFSLKYLVERGEPVSFDYAMNTIIIGDIKPTLKYYKSSFTTWLDEEIAKGQRIKIEEINSINTQKALSVGVNTDRIIESKELFRSHELYAHSLDCMLGLLPDIEVLQIIKEASTLGYLLTHLNKELLARELYQSDIINALIKISTSEKYSGKTYNIAYNEINGNTNFTSVVSKYKVNDQVYEWRMSIQDFITAGCYTLFKGLYDLGIEKVILKPNNNELLIDATTEEN